jgi:hypothetical protein
MPRGDDFGGIFFRDLEELPQTQIPEPYYGEVYFDSSLLQEALTMDQVVAAGDLPIDFEPPVYEGLLLDAIRAARDNDFRAAILYSALGIETLAGTRLDEELQKFLAATPPPPHIRAAESQDGRKKGDLEDPVYKHLRSAGRFPNLLHELPLYVLQKSLKLEVPEAYKQARRLYQTRNSLAHRGEPAKDKDFLPIDVHGAVDAIKCANEVFAWFGARGNWPIPFAEQLERWLRYSASQKQEE